MSSQRYDERRQQNSTLDVSLPQRMAVGPMQSNQFSNTVQGRDKPRSLNGLGRRLTS